MGDELTRKPTRLACFDYSTPSAYFITLCAAERRCCFGSINDSEARLSRLGELVREEWLKVPSHYRGVEADMFVVMPNHLHGIIILKPPGADDSGPALTAVVGNFKGGVTRLWNRGSQRPQPPVWQRGFYERVIRDEDELYYIREYILNNPRRWQLDRENPARTGVDEFDTWVGAAK